MKNICLTVALLLSVGSHPVFASGCTGPGCSASLTGKPKLTLISSNSAEKGSMQSLFSQLGTQETKKLKVNNDSQRKAPGSSSSVGADEAAPVRKYIAIEPEIVQSPILLRPVTGAERFV